MITIVPVPTTRSIEEAKAPMLRMLEQLDFKPSFHKVLIKPNGARTSS
jgi:hypothetical protein